MSNLVQIDDLADEISRLVSDYGKQCTETTKDCVNTVAKKTLQRIKQGSPEKYRWSPPDAAYKVHKVLLSS